MSTFLYQSTDPVLTESSPQVSGGCQSEDNGKFVGL